MKYEDFVEEKNNEVTGRVTEIVSYVFVAFVMIGLCIKILFF